MVGLDRHRPLGERRGHERVAVPVAADPAAQPDERGHLRRPRARRLAGELVVELAVRGRQDLEQRVVEDRHRRTDLVERAGLGGADLGGTPEQVDLLEQPARGSRPAPPRRDGARPARTAACEIRRIADATARRRASVGCAVRTGRNSSPASSVSACSSPYCALTSPTAAASESRTGVFAGVVLAERPDAVVLLGQVGQVEVAGEGAGDVLGALEVPRRHELLAGGRRHSAGSGSSRWAAIASSRSRSTSARRVGPPYSSRTWPSSSPSSRTSARSGAGTSKRACTRESGVVGMWARVVRRVSTGPCRGSAVVIRGTSASGRAGGPGRHISGGTRQYAAARRPAPAAG